MIQCCFRPRLPLAGRYRIKLLLLAGFQPLLLRSANKINHQRLTALVQAGQPAKLLPAGYECAFAANGW